MKHNKRMILILLCLVLVTALAAGLHLATRTQVPDGALLITWDGGEAAVMLEELELAPVQGTVRNGKGEEVAIDGEGVLLSALLAQAGAPEFTQVTAASDDSYSAVVTAEEVAQPDKVYLLRREDGARLVVFGDDNSKRNVSSVVLLTLS